MSLRYKQRRRERYYRNRIWDEPWTPSQGLDQAMFEADDHPCWCGETKPYYAPLEGTCGGSGVIYCHCGGDLCVCHWHGETDCCGCEDCEDTDCDSDDCDDYDPYDP